MQAFIPADTRELVLSALWTLFTAVLMTVAMLWSWRIEDTMARAGLLGAVVLVLAATHAVSLLLLRRRNALTPVDREYNLVYGGGGPPEDEIKA